MILFSIIFCILVLFIVLSLLIPKLRKFVWISKISYFAPIISVITLCIAFIPIFDKIFPPSIKILDITPICVINKRPDLTPKDWPIFDEYSLYLLLNVQSKSRNVFVSAIDIFGKLYLTSNEYFMAFKHVGKTIVDIQKECSEKRPFYQISWSAWPTIEKGAIKLEPHESKLILFTLLEPIISGQRESGYIMPIYEYIGYEIDNIRPKRLNSYPSTNGFLKYAIENDAFYLSGIRDDFQNGNISFQIRLGGKNIIADKIKIKNLKIFHNININEEPLEKLYSRGDKKIK